MPSERTCTDRVSSSVSSSRNRDDRIGRQLVFTEWQDSMTITGTAVTFHTAGCLRSTRPAKSRLGVTTWTARKLRQSLEQESAALEHARQTARDG